MGFLDRIFGRKKKTRRAQVPTGQPQPGLQRPQYTYEKEGFTQEEWKAMEDAATRKSKYGAPHPETGIPMDTFEEAFKVEKQKMKEAQNAAAQAEKTRQNAERTRQNAEKDRRKKEAERIKAEEARQKAWKKRAAEIKAAKRAGRKLPARKHVA